MRQLSIALMFAVLCVGCSEAPREYVVTPGLIRIYGMEEFAKSMGDPDAKPPVPDLMETRIIEKPIEGLGGLGFLIESDPPHTFEVHTIQRLPGVPASVHGPELIEVDESSGAATLRTKKVEVDGGRFFYWSPAAEDPSGQYSIDIFVNGELLRTISFDVRDKV